MPTDQFIILIPIQRMRVAASRFPVAAPVKETLRFQPQYAAHIQFKAIQTSEEYESS